MFPLLRTDPDRAAWIDQVAADIGALATDSRAELDVANRENRFPREIYAELGRRGHLGPMVPKQWGGLGGGVEIGRHGMVTGQVAIQGQRWLLEGLSHEPVFPAVMVSRSRRPGTGRRR